MHNGNLPGTFSANVSSTIPTERDSERDDMKSENRTHAAKRKSFIEWLQYRVHQARAEEEEAQKWADALDDEEKDDDDDEGGDDWDNEDFDDLEYEEYDDEENGDLEDEDDEDEPEEFDDYEEEKELDFDDDDDSNGVTGRFADYFRDEEDMDVEEPDNLDVGRLTKFYRMDDDEGEEDEGFDRLSDLYHMNDEEPDEEPDEEEQEMIQAVGTQAPTGTVGGGEMSKIDKARQLFPELLNQGLSRDEIIDHLIKALGAKRETAISYYEDLKREFGEPGQQQAPGEQGTGEEEGPVDQLPGDQTMELSQEEIDAQDPNAQGIIRTVDDAHLVYKRQMEDGSFEELWIYNLADDLKDALKIRREILNGTDIPRGHTRSEDGQQTYTLQTMGNAQMLHITGLSN